MIRRDEGSERRLSSPEDLRNDGIASFVIARAPEELEEIGAIRKGQLRYVLFPELYNGNVAIGMAREPIVVS